MNLKVSKHMKMLMKTQKFMFLGMATYDLETITNMITRKLARIS